MTIWFDMDGTIADLYGVEGWLEAILAHDTRPYDEAKGIGNLAVIARLLIAVQKRGFKIGIISWTAKNGTAEYNEAVARAKREWLHRHLPSVTWDVIKVVAYGTDKATATGGGILFDDEEPNRTAWGFGAFEPQYIVECLRDLL
jgi:hypothetical protein